MKRKKDNVKDRSHNPKRIYAAADGVRGSFRYDGGYLNTNVLLGKKVLHQSQGPRPFDCFSASSLEYTGQDRQVELKRNVENCQTFTGSFKAMKRAPKKVRREEQELKRRRPLRPCPEVKSAGQHNESRPGLTTSCSDNEKTWVNIRNGIDKYHKERNCPKESFRFRSSSLNYCGGASLGHSRSGSSHSRSSLSFSRKSQSNEIYTEKIPRIDSNKSFDPAEFHKRILSKGANISKPLMKDENRNVVMTDRKALNKRELIKGKARNALKDYEPFEYSGVLSVDAASTYSDEDADNISSEGQLDTSDQRVVLWRSSSFESLTKSIRDSSCTDCDTFEINDAEQEELFCQKQLKSVHSKNFVKSDSYCSGSETNPATECSSVTFSGAKQLLLGNDLLVAKSRCIETGYTVYEYGSKKSSVSARLLSQCSTKNVKSKNEEHHALQLRTGKSKGKENILLSSLMLSSFKEDNCGMYDTRKYKREAKSFEVIDSSEIEKDCEDNEYEEPSPEVFEHVDLRASTEFTPITQRMQSVIAKAIVSPGEVVSSSQNMDITKHDLFTLTGKRWLNDQVVEIFLNMVANRSLTKDFRARNLPKTYSMSTYFFPNLVTRGYSSVKNWTKDVDIFSYSLVLIPIHMDSHWSLATFDFRVPGVFYYDSLGSNTSNSIILSGLLGYLRDEYMDKKGQIKDMSMFAKRTKDTPPQENGSDCGVFCCKVGDYLSRNLQLTFTQEDVTYFRKRMIFEIVKGTLIEP